MQDESTALAAPASPTAAPSLAHEDVVAALFTWQLADPADQDEFAYDDDYARELAAGAAPFWGQVGIESARRRIAEMQPDDSWWDWRELCESRAHELFPDDTQTAAAASRVDDDEDVWC